MNKNKYQYLPNVEESYKLISSNKHFYTKLETNKDQKYKIEVLINNHLDMQKSNNDLIEELFEENNIEKRELDHTIIKELYTNYNSNDQYVNTDNVFKYNYNLVELTYETINYIVQK